MSAIAEDKAGVASGVLTAVRIVGLAVGVAATGVVVRGVEYAKVESLVTQAGRSLDASARVELTPLLSRSPEAVARLAKLLPAVAERVEEMLRVSFDAGFTAGMILCAVVSALSVAIALLVKSRRFGVVERFDA